MSRLLILGAGGHGAVVAEAAMETGLWSEVAFLDDGPRDRSVVGFPVVGSIDQCEALIDDRTDVIVALGDNATRMEILELLARSDRRIVSVIHPSAIISPSVSLGVGSVVCAGVVVNARAEVGRGAILNTACTIDHDCRLAVGVHVSPGAHLAGNVRVGARSWVGIGSAVREGVSIGNDCIIGAGAAVVGDVPSGITVGGVPARELKPA